MFGITIKLLLLFLLNSSTVFCYFENQARILANDGHVVIESALDKNITFRMKGNSFLNVGEVNIVKILESLANFTTAAGELSSGSSYDINLRIQTLSNIVTGRNGLVFKMARLENVTSLDSTRGSGVKTKIRLNQLTQKVILLERRYANLLVKLGEDNCKSNPCQNGGTCLDMYNSYVCQCPKNWEGATCGVDVNECAHFAGTDLGCQNGATCANYPGGYSCLCANNWQGIHCTRRTTDCMSSPPGELCGHGTCVNTNEGVGYKCICEQGWKTNGVTPACTVDVDECADSKPHCSKDPEVSCINLPGSFVCGNCPAGYTGTGFYCVDVNECETNNGGCSTSPMVTCINTRGSSQCGLCPPGFEGDGKTCSLKGSGCATRSNICHPMARCVDNPSGTVSCICPFGYIGSGYGFNGCTKVSTVAGPCARNPCLNGGICRPIGTTNYTCFCRPPFSPPNCSLLTTPCTPNPCLNGGTCVARGNFRTCLCPASTTGNRCENVARSCGGVLDSLNGTLSYPAGNSNSYNHNSRCAWLIKTNSSKVLNVTFTKFNIEDSKDCKFDWLQVHDGRSSASNIIGRFCGTTLPKGGNIVSTHDMLYLWFRSDNSTAHAGFTLNWDSIDPVCGGEFEISSHGTISSPGSPGNYPPNRDCKWFLSAATGKRIQFHFFTMKLEAHQNCSYDFLQIHSGLKDTSPILEKFCNSSHPEPLITPSNEAMLYFHSDDDNNDAGFQISYAVIEGLPGCGGTYTGSTGVFSSPSSNEDEKYPHNLQCEYLIKLPTGSRVQIEFTKFELEESESCKFDFLEMYDGKYTTSPIIGRFCGKNTPSKFISKSNYVLVKFKSDWSTSHPGFAAIYTLICGGVFTSETGIIMSPSYPQTYESNRECQYVIEAPIGKAVILDFMDFEVEGNSYPDCGYDYVRIYDGHDANNNTIMGNYCGDMKPPRSISTLNFMYVEFGSDTSIGGRGFKANYSFVDISCGGIVKSPNTVIRPPTETDGLQYAPGSSCRWIIVAPVGQSVQLLWNQFDLEQSNGCLYDYVEIFDNSSSSRNNNGSIGRYCGTRKPPSMTSAGNMFTVIFKSDNSTAKDGFTLSFSFVDTEKICGGNYFTTSGVIRSPGWPGEYLPGKNCEWVITVPMGQQIQLNVKSFLMERHMNCRFDGLEIRNGGSPQSPLIGKFCGDNDFNNTISFSNKLYLRFYSDASRGYSGFEIEWDGTSTGCGGILSSPTGSIISPNYPEPYGDNVQCVWRISVSQGSTIHLVFTDLDMEVHPACKFDYIDIFDGIDASGRKMGRYCSSNDAVILDTETNHAYIRMRADATTQGRGFSLKYNIDCTKTLSGHEGVIESPNFPSPYPMNLDCAWSITVSKGNKIRMQFSHFNIENSKLIDDDKSHLCHFDYIEIIQKLGDATGSSTRYCNDPPKDSIVTMGTEATVKFHTDSSDAESGFRMEWQVEGCGGLLTHPEGTFSSPNYPDPYPENTHCEWTITADVGYSIQLEVHEFNMEVAGDCRYDGLIIANGVNETQVISHVCHVQTEPMKVTGSGHQMFVKFYSDSTQSYKGFRASYKAVPSKCGGFITTRSGYISSPNYPNNYGRNETCEWTIMTDLTHTLQLQFMDFGFQNSTSCAKDFVAVYDGQEQRDEKLLIKACGGNVPENVIVSSGHALTVLMKSDNDFEAKGFRANHSVNCGQKITTSSNGIISLKDTLKINSENCTWVIKAAEPTQHITLTISHMNILQLDDSCLANLTVHDGDSFEAPERLNICGMKVPPTIVSNGDSLTIHVVSESFYLNNLLGMQFFAHYSVLDNACGGTLTSHSGEFASPNYPKSYPMNTECVWNIVASPGNTLQLFIRSLDILQSENCNSDYLEVREGDKSNKFREVYCGTRTGPVTNITSSNNFWIKFKSGNQGVGRGFIAEYSYVHLNDLYGKTGTITSPLFPRLYAKNDVHSWRVTVEMGSVINIKFKVFEVDGSSDICSGEIKVFDGYDDTANSLGSTLCGMSVPDPLRTTGNVIFIQLDHIEAREPSRFLLEWEQVEKVVNVNETDTEGTKCGGHTTITLSEEKPSTNITSPGYPFGYSPNMNCSWIIKSASSNFHPIFGLFNIDLEESDSCLSDYVEISSSNDLATWSKIARRCTFDLKRDMFFEGTPYLKVDFHTDFLINRTGFNGLVSLKCGGVLNEPNGVIKVVSFVNRTRNFRIDTSCMWNITVRPGRTIQLEFEKIRVATNQDQKTCKGFVMIKNGIDEQSPLLGDGKYCGNELKTIPKTYSNRAFIKYQAGSVITDEFVLKYQEVGIECGGNFILSKNFNSTIITSPNFPNIPNPHTECAWTFVVPTGERVKVDFFERFDLTSTVSCSKEYVELRDGGTSGSKLIGTFCEGMPEYQLSKSNVLRFKYFTDVLDPKNGFKAKISIATCGGMFRASAGYIQSPNYPTVGTYPSKSTCEYYIVGKPSSIMNLSFIDLHLPGNGSNCSLKDNIKLYSVISDGNDTELLLGTYCGTKIPPQISSESNQVKIVFQTFNPNVIYRGFNLNYNTTSVKCGYEINAESGDILSPGYPTSTFLYKRMCEWRIMVPKGRRVRVDIIDKDMISDGSSFSQRVAFYHGHNYYTRIRFLTGTDPTNDTVYSSSNKMLIHLMSRVTTKHRGFKFHFSSEEPTICEGDFNGDIGFIEAPKNQTTFDCEYDRETPLIPTSANLGTLALEFKDVKAGRYMMHCIMLQRGIFVMWRGAKGDGQRYLKKFCGNGTVDETVRSPFSGTRIIAKQGMYLGETDFKLNYKVHQCGGQFGHGETHIIKPDFRNGSYGKVECAWSFTFSPQSTISIEMKVFNLKSDCSKEYVNIYNGAMPMSPLLGRFCGNIERMDDMATQRNNLFVEYHSDNNNLESKFDFKIIPKAFGCGGTLQKNVRSFASPTENGQYPNNVECIWIIKSDPGYHIGAYFVGRYYIEDSLNCTKDYLEFFNNVDEKWVSLGRVCGRDTPKPFNSTGNMMKVIFRSDSSISGDGFNVNWEQNCGGVYYAGEMKRTLTSPNYPRNYDRLTTCNYTIIPPQDQFLRINFLDFDLEQSEGSICNYDSVIIYKQPEYLTYTSWDKKGTYCKKISPGSLRNKEKMAVVFKTDRYVERKGFKFEYFVDKCGGDVLNSTRIETTLPEGNDLQSTFTCLWNITAPENKNIVIRFETLVLQHSDGCHFESIEVYRSHEKTSLNRLAQLCGNLTEHVPSITIDSNKGILALRSDRITPSSGSVSALILFVDKCDKSITLDANSPSYELKLTGNDNNKAQDCQFVVKAPEGYNVVIEFNQFHIGTINRTGCINNFVEIRDGSGPFSELMGKYCGQILPESTSTFGSAMYVRFVTSSSLLGTGFEAVISIRPSPCGKQYYSMINSTGVTVVTPQYYTADKYPPNTKCIWIFEADSGKSVDIEFKDFNLEAWSEEKMCKDKLEIIDKNLNSFVYEGLGEDVIFHGKSQSSYKSSFYHGTRQPNAHHIYCGSTIPSNYISYSSKVYVKFESDSETEAKGLKLDVKTVSACTRNYTRLQGRIYLHENKFTEPCVISIDVPENYTISLYFGLFYFPNSCETGGVKVYDGGINGNLTGTFCNYMTPDPMFSKTNSVAIKVIPFDGPQFFYSMFDVTYVATKEGRGCGGTIFNYGGIFTSPFYPVNERKNSDCVWDVNVPNNMVVALKFKVFDLGDKVTCSSDYVQIMEKDNAGNAKVVRQYCGDDEPAVYTATKNTIQVRYKKTVNFQGTGWSAQFMAVYENAEITEW